MALTLEVKFTLIALLDFAERKKFQKRTIIPLSLAVLKPSTQCILGAITQFALLISWQRRQENPTGI